MVCYSFNLLFYSTFTWKLCIINRDIIICYTEGLPMWITLIDFTLFMVILYALGYNTLILISIEGMWFRCYTLEFILHLHHLHCIWSHVVNLWLRPYRYSIVYCRNTMQLHTLLGVKAGVHIIALHMHILQNVMKIIDRRCLWEVFSFLRFVSICIWLVTLWCFSPWILNLSLCEL